MRFSALRVSVSVFLLGCVSTSTSPVSRLVVTIGVSQPTFRTGDTVVVTTTVANRSGQPQVLHASDCPPAFIATTQSGVVVAPDTANVPCALLLIQRILAPGEQARFEQRWNGSGMIQTSNNSGASPGLLSPGKYVLRGLMRGAGLPLSDPLVVTITP
jgi:hypothetical protein